MHVKHGMFAIHLAWCLFQKEIQLSLVMVSLATSSVCFKVYFSSGFCFPNEILNGALSETELHEQGLDAQQD